ncbi:MAG: CBS domain-containing protein [Candidatus Schekmanbacteria bacterium]|nr:CBS domain-containing protein [Candidatus Schekmanbacteria bacterium]
MLVRDKMKPNPKVVSPTDSLHVAWMTMRENDIRHLPVVDRELRLVGVITERDLRLNLPSPLESATPEQQAAILARYQALRVGDCMTREVKVVAPTTPAQDAAWLIISHKVGGLPVVEHDRVVGVITRSDLLEALVEVLDTATTTTRVEVVVEEKPGAYATLASLVEQRGGTVVSALAARSLESDRSVLIFRLATPDLDELKEALRAAGHPVLSGPR